MQMLRSTTQVHIVEIAVVMTWLSAPAALFAASIGAISVFKAVYIDKRKLRCACVGGDSKVPWGFVSLNENLLMIGMASGCSRSCDEKAFDPPPTGRITGVRKT